MVAIGGSAAEFPFPIEEGAAFMDATEAYLNPDQVGRNVVVVGAGLTGTEAEIHWGSRAAVLPCSVVPQKF